MRALVLPSRNSTESRTKLNRVFWMNLSLHVISRFCQGRPTYFSYATAHFFAHSYVCLAEGRNYMGRNRHGCSKCALHEHYIRRVFFYQAMIDTKIGKKKENFTQTVHIKNSFLRDAGYCLMRPTRTIAISGYPVGAHFDFPFGQPQRINRRHRFRRPCLCSRRSPTKRRTAIGPDSPPIDGVRYEK